MHWAVRFCSFCTQNRHIIYFQFASEREPRLQVYSMMKDCSHTSIWAMMGDDKHMGYDGDDKHMGYDG